MELNQAKELHTEPKRTNPVQSDLRVNYSESEDLIWERFKNGSQQALTYMYREYAQLLFNYGCQFTSDRALVKDCLQEMFIDLINSRERLSGTSSIKFYLMKSLRNKVVRAVQKDKKNNKSAISEENTGFAISISPELKMINGQLDEQRQLLLNSTLNKLPDLQKEALLLFYYEGLSYKQISEVLNIKVKSSRALIYRAIDSLKTHLTPLKSTIFTIVLSVILLF